MRETHHCDSRRLVTCVRRSLSLLCCLALVIPVQGQEPLMDSDEPPVDYSIVVTGSELLSGVYADSHTFFLTRTLRPLGLHCVSSLSVDDRGEDIKHALRFSQQRSRLVIVTGGLGPTDSDITREALSDLTGIGLHEQPDVLQEMSKRFGVPPEQLRANLRRQTRVPDRGTFLPNDSGTAVGLVFEQDDRVIVALPGPPRELQSMVRDYLVPYLAKKFGVHTIGCALTVRFVGIGQSQIDQTMKDHMRIPADLMQTSQFEAGRVDFTFALPHDTPRDHQRLELLRQELHKYLGDHIYADDPNISLEDATVAQVAARGQSVSLAEVGSCGALAVGLAQSEVGRRTIVGDFVAPSQPQLQQMLQIPSDRWATASSRDRLELLATAVGERTHSDWVIVVGEATSSALTPNQQVAVLIKSPDGKMIHSQLPWADLSPAHRDRLTTQLLDYVRRVLAPPTP